LAPAIAGAFFIGGLFTAKNAKKIRKGRKGEQKIFLAFFAAVLCARENPANGWDG
jgi:hypothetical protein